MTNTLAKHINDFLNHKTDMGNGSIKTYEAYSHDLVMQFLPFLTGRKKMTLSQITQQDVEMFLIDVKKKSRTGSVANMRRKLYAIKSFFEYAQRKGLIKENVASDIKPPKNHTKTISYLTDEEKELLLGTVEAIATPFYKLRDLAILKLFLATGMRVSELTNLRLKDLEFHTKQTSFIKIKRKGGNEVRLPIKHNVVYAIKTYLAKRDKPNSYNFVFLSKNNKQMEANSVYHLVKHYLQDAGIEKNKWGPHILRHTVGVSLRRQGIDIATIQHLLGHTKLETTAIYLNVEAQDLERAVQLL